MELVIGALIAFAVELLVLALVFAPRSTRDMLVGRLRAAVGRLRVRRPRLGGGGRLRRSADRRGCIAAAGA